MSFKLVLRVTKSPHKSHYFANYRYVHTGDRQSSSLLWLSSPKVSHTFNLPQSKGTARAGTEGSSPHIPSHMKAPLLVSSSSSSSSSSLFVAAHNSTATTAPPLVLDPPFTPVPGELDVLRHSNCNADVPDEVYYTCCVCKTVLFSSAAYAPSSAIGQHCSGWPMFTSPLSSRALKLRSLLQRVAVERGSGAPLRATLATRGLRVEGDMVRRTSRGNCVPAYQQITWREECLRDVNKRSDPALVEGCCTTCGACVCRVTVEKRGGVNYLVNPTAVVARRRME